MNCICGGQAYHLRSGERVADLIILYNICNYKNYLRLSSYICIKNMFSVYRLYLALEELYPKGFYVPITKTAHDRQTLRLLFIV